MPKQENKLTSTKSNNLIDAGFFKKLNSMEMRIVNLAISQLNPLRSLKQNRAFEFTVKEFLSVNSGVENYAEIYNTIRNAILRLSNVWVQVEPLEGYDYSEISLLTDRSYSKGKGRFMIEFHEKAMPYLAEIKNNYTSILLDTFGSLKSEYSLKMYEFLSRWAFHGKVNISLIELKELLDVVNVYPRYNSFNQRVLTPALKEINAKTNLIVDLKTIRTGRKITDLEFTISDKSTAIDVTKRPKFPHKNKYGKYVKFNSQNPTSSSVSYANYAKDCLKILEEFYQDKALSDVDLKDLHHYYNFLSVSNSHKSKLGNKSDFLTQIKNRGYTLVEGDLKKISEKSATSEDKFAISPRPTDDNRDELTRWAKDVSAVLRQRQDNKQSLTMEEQKTLLECYELLNSPADIFRQKMLIERLEKEKDR